MTQPLDFFKYKNGILHSENISLKEIAEAIGTPVYIYSKEALITPFKKLKEGLKGLDVTVCFAVKSNPNLSILKLLHEEGAGMDIVSGGELHRASLVGVPAEKIVFSGVGKTVAEMQSALQYERGKGIQSFNVESIEELETLSEVAQEMMKKARVALRFNPDVNAKTHPYISTGLKKNKFGMNESEIIGIAKEIKKFRGISLSGLSIHIGSQLLDLSPLDDSFKKTLQLIDQLNAILPEPLQWVDLGGGLGITYKDEETPSIPSYCKLIRQHFFANRSHRPPLQIMIEPGRIISGNAGVLITKVLFRKQRKDRDFLIVDAGMNDLIRPALYDSFHEIIPVQQIKGVPRLKKTTLVGPVCESSDFFAKDKPLSSSLQSGEFLAILSAGAYGFSMASTYNSRPRPPEILIKKDTYQVIRTRETYLDLVQQELV